ncbi:MAG: hypothetical protein IKL92_00305, partial [Oscillospiraceae bacterium]|nr:hypothetical protein [Oscillospiraceae bacterium]
YSLADTAAYISLTVGAPIADPDSDITATPQLFEEDYSFDAEEDHIFYFEEDSSSWFEVNTKSQKDIVLAFDTEWDDDLADEIYEKNPNADLDFYNGNYAKFSKTGTLWLGYPEDDADDAYVYAVSSSGKLSLVNAEYDEYEEAFAIRTNTLGRYVISTEKLKLSSTSSGGSGSGTGTGTGTVVSSSKSSAAAPVSSSKPASSTPVSSSKPASSTPASSQVSSQESSKESKPSSEPLSIKEPSSEEDNKHVSGTTDPEDNDVPTKKGGVSWIVWLLILAGLVAVVIAVGVIFYTKKNSGRRML